MSTEVWEALLNVSRVVGVVLIIVAAAWAYVASTQDRGKS